MSARPQSGKPRSSRRLLLLAFPVLLAVAVAVNLDSLMQVVSGQRSLRSVIYGINVSEAELMLGGWPLPHDSGSPDAKVVVEAFLMAGDPCHIDTAFMARALGKVEPSRLRVKFVNTAGGQGGLERRDKVKLGCEQGFAINGKTEFKVPDPATPGKKRTVFTAHQRDGQGLAPLYPILNQELKAVYKGKGMSVTQAEFDEMIAAEVKRLHNEAVAEAEARKAALEQKK